MKRLYENLIADHFRRNRQMLLLMGPRQVGKTTTARTTAESLGSTTYLNWDNVDHRRRILAGPEEIAGAMGLQQLAEAPPICVLDELHKCQGWKTLLKGLFDTYGDRARFLVTGSAHLGAFRAGGDSLMGRYFGYRMHPLSVGELVRPRLSASLIRTPRPLPDDAFHGLLQWGGFPEPFLRGEATFWHQWNRTRDAQLFKEDLRDLTRVREVGQVEVLGVLLRERAGQLTSFASLAGELRASVDSVRRWIRTLEALYFCFAVRPWHRNVARSLRKEPKYYPWDWTQAMNEGARAEAFVAGALLKAVQLWTDRGLGDFGLFFLRDKAKREVDFLVVRDDEPWFLVEVKSTSSSRPSPQLAYFQKQTGARHAFEVAMNLPYVDRDAFEHEEPIIVPARTFLSQLP